jgi:hypothetical protein
LYNSSTGCPRAACATLRLRHLLTPRGTEAKHVSTFLWSWAPFLPTDRCAKQCCCTQICSTSCSSTISSCSSTNSVTRALVTLRSLSHAHVTTPVGAESTTTCCWACQRCSQRESTTTSLAPQLELLQPTHWFSTKQQHQQHCMTCEGNTPPFQGSHPFPSPFTECPLGRACQPQCHIIISSRRLKPYQAAASCTHRHTVLSSPLSHESAHSHPWSRQQAAAGDAPAPDTTPLAATAALRCHSS